MKRTWIIVLLGISLSGEVVAQDGFTIRGRFSNLDNDTKILLSYSDGDQAVRDSAIVKNGAFVINGKILLPCRAILQVNSGNTVPGEGRALNIQGGGMARNMLMNGDAQEFFLEKGVTSVTGTNKIKTAIIKGGKSQTDYLSLQSQLDTLQRKMNPLSEKMKEYFKENNDAGRKELFPKLQALRSEMIETEKKFIRDNPDSYVSLDLVADAMTKDLSYEPLFVGLTNKLKNTPTGRELAKQIMLSDKTSPGKPAINFSQSDKRGNVVSFASLRGKFVLIDFWASWCKPCREENPNLLRAYNQFKNKNFEIIGISLDDKKEPWLKAIEADGLPWIQLSDLKKRVEKQWRLLITLMHNFSKFPRRSGKAILLLKNLRDELIKTLDMMIERTQVNLPEE